MRSYVCPRRKVVWGLKSLGNGNKAAVLKHIFLKFRVGDGSKIYLWLDFWHLDGILSDHYGYRDNYDAGSKFDAKLSSVIRGTNWEWLPARSKYLVNIESKLPLIKIGGIQVGILLFGWPLSQILSQVGILGKKLV